MSLNTSNSIHTLSTGAAIFSMFFGAGNAVFPIQLGIGVGDFLIYALIGLLLTGIGGPLLGLITALSYRGDSLKFYSSWGKKLGLFFLFLSLALLGPFCVLPRCYIVAHSAAESLLPNLSAIYFFIIFSVLSFFCSIKKNKLLNILGYILSPILLICLITIIINGINTGNFSATQNISPSIAFYNGIYAGYDTMDLIAAIIFSGSIWSLLSLKHKDEIILRKVTWRASLLGGGLLGVVYCGLAVAASMHTEALSTIAPENLLTTLAKQNLSTNFAIVANLAIALACFTTVVSLTYSIARIICTEILSNKISELHIILIITLFSTFFATVKFSTIQNMLHPILNIVYPVIIILTLVNLYTKFSKAGKNCCQAAK